jgi:ribosomal protein L20
MNGLKNLHIEMNRKSLSELAVNEPDAFKSLVEKVKAAQG